jgi:hypothetical protein
MLIRISNPDKRGNIESSHAVFNAIPSKRVMSSPLEHKTIFFSEFRLVDLMLYVATKFD